MIFRDLEKVRSIIKSATELDVSYAYDDLVFPEHAAFLIQFDDRNPKNIYCHFREDCDEILKKHILAKLIEAGSYKNVRLMYKGIFNLKQKGEEIEVSFLNDRIKKPLHRVLA